MGHSGLAGEDNPAFVHGHNCRGGRSAEYHIWSGIKDRVLNKNTALYPFYGGRGITIEPSWSESFEAFLTDVGPRPSTGHSLDRIDNDQGYHPDNVRWATKKEQARNRRSNIVIEYRGETRCLKEWCEVLGVNYKRTWRRVNAGWTFEKAISEAPRKGGYNG